MSRRGLFEFATKELSQDAFLGWLFSNYNDKRVGKCSKEFLSTLTKLEKNHNNHVRPDDIEKAEVTLQYAHMDIIIDFWTKDGKQRLMVIEDKAFTNEHYQLKTYDDEIKKWNEDFEKKNHYQRQTYRIFYKTGEIDLSELDRVKDAEWNLFDLEKIYNFFKNKKNTEDEILNDYIDYVCSLYKDRTQLSDKNPIDWNFNNWKFFFNNKIKPQHSGFTYDYGMYLGRYLSIMVYFDDWENMIQSTCLEIFFRKHNEISATVHPFNCQAKSESWKRTNNNEICESIHNAMPSDVDFSFKRYEKAQTVATSKTKLTKNDLDEVEYKINQWMNDFKSFFIKQNLKE